jgi:hypothetical protein
MKTGIQMNILLWLRRLIEKYKKCLKKRITDGTSGN